MPRTKQRTPELKDRLLAAAMSTLAGAGVAGFTARRVAEGAETSVPAVYELFGDKAGLVREVFFAGFRKLGDRFGELPDSADPRADLVAVFGAFRAFVAENPELTTVMYSRPFVDFDPGPAERSASARAREFIVGRIRRCVDAGVLAGDPVDIAHVLLALAQGLAAQESAGWLGSTPASVDRRWTLAIRAALAGFAPSTVDG